MSGTPVSRRGGFRRGGGCDFIPLHHTRRFSSLIVQMPDRVLTMAHRLPTAAGRLTIIRELAGILKENSAPFTAISDSPGTITFGSSSVFSALTSRWPSVMTLALLPSLDSPFRNLASIPSFSSHVRRFWAVLYEQMAVLPRRRLAKSMLSSACGPVT